MFIKSTQREEEKMEREKEILLKVREALPHMSEFDKGYILCLAEKSEVKPDKKEDETELLLMEK